MRQHDIHMEKAAPQQKRAMIIAGSALALGVGAMYYMQPKSYEPQVAAHKTATSNDGNTDANPTAQSTDVREKAK